MKNLYGTYKDNIELLKRRVEEGSGDQSEEEIGIVYEHRKTQTRLVKFLFIKDIYEKLYRPNLYDLGGTYAEDVADFWFRYQTEQVGKIFLLHIFVSNHHEASFNISLSVDSTLNLDNKSDFTYLSPFLKENQFTKVKDHSHSYLSTYHFSELDVELLQGKKMYIPIKIDCDKSNGSRTIIDDIQANHNFGTLLKDPVCSDYVVESKDGTKFKVHKVILAAQSKVFNNIFKEDDQNVLVKKDNLIEDVESHDLVSFLQFMYTGALEDIENCDPITLLGLADKYEVSGLKILMEIALCQQLNTENALKILVWSDFYNLYTLKLAALKFLKQYPATMNTPEFKQIRNTDLIHEVCLFIAS